MPRIIVLPVVLLIGWLGGGTWFWVCQVRGMCENEPTDQVVPTQEAVAPNPYATRISYHNSTWMVWDDTLRFARNTSTPIFSTTQMPLIERLADYLSAHPSLDLQIVAAYSENERNDGKLPNLGLGRAHAIAQEFIERGVEDSRFIMLPQEVEDSVFVQDTLLGGVSMALIDRAVTTRIDAVLKDSGSVTYMSDIDETAEAPTEVVRSVPVSKPEKGFFFFKLNEFQIILGQAEREYITQMITYLRQNPKSTLLLTGHADNSGTAEANMDLSKQRAEAVKGYFESFGLDTDRIQLSHEGSNTPIASNDTEEGRARNRRVEATVQ